MSEGEGILEKGAFEDLWMNESLRGDLYCRVFFG